VELQMLDNYSFDDQDIVDTIRNIIATIEREENKL